MTALAKVPVVCLGLFLGAPGAVPANSLVGQAQSLTAHLNPGLSFQTRNSSSSHEMAGTEFEALELPAKLAVPERPRLSDFGSHTITFAQTILQDPEAAFYADLITTHLYGESLFSVKDWQAFQALVKAQGKPLAQTEMALSLHQSESETPRRPRRVLRPQPEGRPSSQPNLLFILTDDLDAPSVAFMPNLKALLIDQGVSFSNCFASFSLCCPARATILRGQYAHNTQILGNVPPQGGFQKFYSLGEESSTVATWLKAAGYRTMYVGKYLNGYPNNAGPAYIPPGWDEWHSAVQGDPYSEYNYTLNENGQLVSYGSAPEDYGTDVYVRKAVDFIQRTAQEGKPFFIHLSVYAPHGPATPAPRHKGLFPDAQAPRTPNFNEEDVTDKPTHIRNQSLLTPQQISQIDSQYRKRLQSLQAVDEGIASLIEALAASGQLERTYIFFSSDNGFHLGNHRLLLGKVAPYEEDIRVPLVVRGPGVPVGQTREHLVGNVDLAPTWAELAGAQTPDFVDGRSLVPLLGNNPPPPESWRQAFLLENGDLATQTRVLTSEPGDLTMQIREVGVPPFRGLRTQNLLYVEYNTGERELYDLSQDPYELENRVSTADPALLLQLSSWLAQMQRCAGASCRAAEEAPPLQAALPGWPASPWNKSPGFSGASLPSPAHALALTVPFGDTVAVTRRPRPIWKRHSLSNLYGFAGAAPVEPKLWPLLLLPFKLTEVLA